MGERVAGPSGEWMGGWHIPRGHYQQTIAPGGTAAYDIYPMWQNFGYLPHVELSIRLTIIPDAPPPAQKIGVYKDGIGWRIGLVGRWREGVFMSSSGRKPDTLRP